MPSAANLMQRCRPWKTAVSKKVHTLLYTLFYPLKKRSLLHTERVYVWFSTVSIVKVWIFKCSPPLWCFYRVYLLIFGWFSGVKAYAFHPSQAFTARVNALLPMWTLWNQSLHTRYPCKSEENEHCVNGWILFSGNKLRIYARVKRAFTKQISAFSVRLFRFVCPAGHSMKFSSKVADYFAQVLE